MLEALSELPPRERDALRSLSHASSGFGPRSQQSGPRRQKSFPLRFLPETAVPIFGDPLQPSRDGDRVAARLSAECKPPRNAPTTSEVVRSSAGKWGTRKFADNVGSSEKSEATELARRADSLPGRKDKRKPESRLRRIGEPCSPKPTVGLGGPLHLEPRRLRECNVCLGPLPRALTPQWSRRNTH